MIGNFTRAAVVLALLSGVPAFALDNPLSGP